MIKAITIRLSDGRQLMWDFDFSLQGTMRMTNVFPTAQLDWIRLEHCQCPDCVLKPDEFPTCPVAEVLASYARDLANRKSYEKVSVDVYQDNAPKLTINNIPLQNVVRELVRLAVFQYECPVGRKVKPVMTALPPFPSNEEILHAFALAFAPQAEASHGELNQEQMHFLEQLHDVFGNLSVRLEHVGQGDAHLNGVVILHSLAVLFTLSAPELIRAVQVPAKPAEDESACS
jgi:hypothetical protein